MTDVSSERTDFIPYPTNCVVGTVRDADAARTAIDTLLRAGFDREDIDILHGEKDLQRLDPAEHGFLAQFQRTLIRTFEQDEFEHLMHHLEDVRAGRFVLMVLTKRRGQRSVAADILNRNGAEFVGFYGRWAWQDLSAPAQIAPEDIPAWFVRALSERDSNVLASMFDEDAEFVNVSGVCWHDRDSIRKAHAERLERIFNQSALVPEAVKVKRLSPDIAVVHARLTLSDQPSDRGAASPGSDTTIVSFVVHRIGERWLIASVHHTDVIPNVETSATEQAGMFRAAHDHSRQVS